MSAACYSPYTVVKAKIGEKTVRILFESKI